MKAIKASKPFYQLLLLFLSYHRFAHTQTPHGEGNKIAHYSLFFVPFANGILFLFFAVWGCVIFSLTLFPTCRFIFKEKKAKDTWEKGCQERENKQAQRSGKGKNTNLPFLFWVCVFLLPFPLRFVFRIVTNGKIQIIQRKLICGLFSRWLRYDSKDKGKHTTHTQHPLSQQTIKFLSVNCRSKVSARCVCCFVFTARQLTAIHY